jgi:hypothetical protein
MAGSRKLLDDVVTKCYQGTVFSAVRRVVEWVCSQCSGDDDWEVLCEERPLHYEGKIHYLVHLFCTIDTCELAGGRNNKAHYWTSYLSIPARARSITERKKLLLNMRDFPTWVVLHPATPPIFLGEAATAQCYNPGGSAAISRSISSRAPRVDDSDSIGDSDNWHHGIYWCRQRRPPVSRAEYIRKVGLSLTMLMTMCFCWCSLRRPRPEKIICSIIYRGSSVRWTNKLFWRLHYTPYLRLISQMKLPVATINNFFCQGINW